METYLHQEVEKYPNTNAIKATKFSKEAHCILQRKKIVLDHWLESTTFTSSNI